MEDGMDEERDEELEAAIRVSDIAHRHAIEIHNIFTDGQPISIEYAEELVRCAIEEALGEGRQKPAGGYDRVSDHFPYL
jgi:hypothetical protein